MGNFDERQWGISASAVNSGRTEPRFAVWPVGKIAHELIQLWVNDISADRLSPRTVRWTHSALNMTLYTRSTSAVFSILAYAVLRFGVLTGLHIDAVDLDARRIRVRRSISQVAGKLVEGTPKSKAGRRSVPLPERLVPVLKARIDGRAY